ncbi:hypothetical protein BCO18430_04236 [Burkholderia contaminans]|nr:hypothetical protein BCO18430_04236 [Burkholderia contaminans]
MARQAIPEILSCRTALQSGTREFEPSHDIRQLRQCPALMEWRARFSRHAQCDARLNRARMREGPEFLLDQPARKPAAQALPRQCAFCVTPLVIRSFRRRRRQLSLRCVSRVIDRTILTRHPDAIERNVRDRDTGTLNAGTMASANASRAWICSFIELFRHRGSNPSHGYGSHDAYRRSDDTGRFVRHRECLLVVHSFHACRAAPSIEPYRVNLEQNSRCEQPSWTNLGKA